MSWPQSTDYYEAIQNPSLVFQDADLRSGKPALNPLAMPLPCSGNFADVYQVHSADRRKSWAVKLFTREVAERERRFADISRHIQRNKLPFMVDFRYFADGIKIRGAWRPLLKMTWVEGQTLNEFVRTNLGKPQMLLQLAGLLRRMLHELRQADMAHGDLQHGNLLLVENLDGRLGIKLIDYDGMYVPTLCTVPSGEVGHPNYQHPQRLREGTYNREVDRFAGLVIYTALRTLTAAGRQLWDRYDNGDNLLFREADFAAPESSSLFRELLQAKDLAVQSLAGYLLLAAKRDVADVPLLEMIVGDEGGVVPLSAGHRSDIAAALAHAAPARGVPSMSAVGTANPMSFWQMAALPANVPVTNSPVIVGNAGYPVVRVRGVPSLPPAAGIPAQAPPTTRVMSPVGITFAVVGGVMLLGLCVAAGVVAMQFGSLAPADNSPPVGVPSHASPVRPSTVVAGDPQSRPAPPNVPNVAPSILAPSATSPAPILRGSGWSLIAKLSHPTSDGKYVGRISAVCFLDSDTQAVSLGDEGSLRFWDLRSQKELSLTSLKSGEPLRFTCAAVSLLGDKLVIGCEKGLVEVDRKTLGVNRVGFGKTPAGVVSQVAYISAGNAVGQFVLAGGPDSLRRFDMRSQAMESFDVAAIGHAPFVITPSGKAIVMQHDANGESTPVLFRLFDMREQKRMTSVYLAQTFLAADNPVHTLVGCTAQGIITIWDTRTGKMARQMGSSGSVTALDVDGSCTRAVTGGADGSVRVWNVLTAGTPLILGGHTSAVRAVTIGADKRLILTGSDDGTVRLWRLDE